MWGPSPSEVVDQAANYGQRLLQTLSAAVSEGQKNYVAKQQVEVEKQRNQILGQEAATGAKNAQTESDRLRYGLMAKDLADDLQRSGPMSYVNRKSEWLQYFTYEAGGDKAQGQALYEGGASGLNRITGVEAYRNNILGIASAGAQGQTPSSAPQSSAGPAATSPLAPFAGQQAPSATPAPMTQAARPQSSPTAAVPSQPSAFVQAPQSASVSMTVDTRGLAPNAKASADSAFAKIGGIAVGSVDPSTPVSSKDQTAMNIALKPHVEILRNSKAYEQFIAGGGSEQAAERARAQLEEAVQNPDFKEWLTTSSSLTKDESASYGRTVVDQATIYKITETVRHNQAIENDKFLNTAASAAYDNARVDLLSQRIAIEAKNANNKGAQLVDQSLKLANDAVKSFAAVSNAAIKDHFGNKQPSDQELATFLDQQFLDPRSAMSSTLTNAVNLYSAVMHVDPKDLPTVTKEWEARYKLGIPLPFMQTSAGGSVTTTPVPSNSGTPGPSPSGANPPPQGGRKATPTKQQMSDQDLLKAAAQ
jgi:hypothetical protein